MDNLGKEFTGEGFMNYDDLVKIVKSYQQRTFCEDVDVLRQLGGELGKVDLISRHRGPILKAQNFDHEGNRIQFR